MKIKQIFKRATALLLVLLCVLPAASCSSQTVQKSKPEHVFNAKYSNLSGNMKYVQNFRYVDGKLYVSGYNYETSDYTLCVLNEDGTVDKTLIFYNDSENYYDKPIFGTSISRDVISTASDSDIDNTDEADETADPDAGVSDTADTKSDPDEPADDEDVANEYYNIYLNAHYITNAGNILMCLCENYYNYDTGENRQSFSVRCIDSDGKELFNVNISEAFKDTQDFYGFYNFSEDKEGNFYCTGGGDRLYVMDPAFNLLKVVEPEFYINQMVAFSDGTIYAQYWDDATNRQQLKPFDLASGTFGEPFSLDGLSSQMDGFYVPSSPDSAYPLFFQSNSGIFAYDPNTKQTVEILNWINSDIDNNSINSINIVDEKKIYASSFDSTANACQLVEMNYVAPEDVVEKYVITLATASLDYNLRGAIFKFNRENSEYRISVKDYSIYNTSDDWNRSITNLNNDIVKGDIPDILHICSDMPVTSYISKGMFADLYPLIEVDETIDLEKDYFTNVFKAFEVNGKLYELIPNVNIRTIVGKTSIVGEGPGWTMDEFNAVLAAHPNAMAFDDMTQEQLLELVCTVAIDQFIDRSTGKCSFDSDGFVKVLEFAKNLSQKSKWDDFNWEEVDDDYWLNQELAYREDRVLLQAVFLYGYEQYWNLMMGTYGEDITFIGVPTDDRNGSSMTPELELAISSRSKYKDAAWEFLRYFLSDEYQSTLSWTVPVMKSQLQKQAEVAMKPQTWTDEDGNVHEYDNSFWIGDKEINIGRITQEYVDKFDAFLASIDRVARQDSTMMDIIKDDAKDFFGGAKSAEETAKIIQDRVQKYISESR